MKLKLYAHDCITDLCYTILEGYSHQATTISGLNLCSDVLGTTIDINRESSACTTTSPFPAAQT